jgi:hypothetical protein
VISRFIFGGVVGGGMVGGVVGGGMVGGVVGGMVGGMVGGTTRLSWNKQPSGPSRSVYMFIDLASIGNWFIGLPFHTPPSNHFNFLFEVLDSSIKKHQRCEPILWAK